MVDSITVDSRHLLKLVPHAHIDWILRRIVAIRTQLITSYFLADRFDWFTTESNNKTSKTTKDAQNTENKILIIVRIRLFEFLDGRI